MDGQFVCCTKAWICLRRIMLWLGVAARDMFNMFPSRAASLRMMDNIVPKGQTNWAVVAATPTGRPIN